MTTSTLQRDENLETYLKICVNSYGENKDQNNRLGSEWEKLNLVINGQHDSTKYYYGFDELNGFDAAIYHNTKTGEVIECRMG